MKVSVLIGSRNRVHVLERCLKSVLLQDYTDFEVVILDNSDDPKEDEEIIRLLGDLRVRLLYSPLPIGVSSSRNKLMENANGEILFIIDDDAFLDERNAFSIVSDIFRSYPDVGIVACKIKNHGFIKKNHNVPFSMKSLKRIPWVLETSCYSSYFLGTAHAIRMKVIEECGIYNPELFFGEEELDLSYRVISHGWKICYELKILVHHVPQPSVIDNGGQAGELYHHVKNRVYLAYRYLPGYCIPSYLGVWLVKYLVDAIKTKAIRKYIAGIVAGVSWLPRIRRDPLKPEAVRYLRENFGRLWY